MNEIQFWKMGWNLNARKLSPKNFCMFLTSHPRNDDLIGSNIWCHFRSWKIKTAPIFFGKSSIAFEFLSLHFWELNSVHPDRSYVDLFIFKRKHYLWALVLNQFGLSSSTVAGPTKLKSMFTVECGTSTGGGVYQLAQKACERDFPRFAMCIWFRISPS